MGEVKERCRNGPRDNLGTKKKQGSEAPMRVNGPSRETESRGSEDEVRGKAPCCLQGSPALKMTKSSSLNIQGRRAIIHLCKRTMSWLFKSLSPVHLF